MSSGISDSPTAIPPGHFYTAQLRLLAARAVMQASERFNSNHDFELKLKSCNGGFSMSYSGPSCSPDPPLKPPADPTTPVVEVTGILGQ